MPFKSYKQQLFMFSKHPEIAKRWADKYGTLKKSGVRNAVKKKVKENKSRKMRNQPR